MPLVRDRPLVVFFLVSLLIALGAMAIRATDPAALGAALREIFANNERADIISGVRYAVETPVLWNALLFPAAPTLAAFIVIAAAYGPGGLRRWLLRLLPWRGVPWRQGVAVWCLAFVAFLALVAIVMLHALSIGETGALNSMLDRYGGALVPALGLLAFSLLVSSGPLLEEMGWRGFALPMLLTRFSPLMASVIVGLLWALWHLPREIGPLMSGAEGAWTAFAFKQLNFFPGCVAASILATFLYFKLGGSVWGGILVHAFHNEIVVNVMRVPEPDIMIGAFALRGWGLIEIVAALVIIVLTRAKLGAPADPSTEPHPFATHKAS